MGREVELRRLRALAAPARLVTIVGPAGAGKSRLALELARGFARPVEVSLRGSRSEEALLAAVASSLGIQLGRGGTKALGLGRAATLAGVSLLLCDACEGLDESACRALSEIRAAAPHLTVVLTSQRALGLDAELPFSLGSMSDADARALFTSRVAHARGGGGLDPVEVGQVDALLERLANLPLAVELAASRLAVLNVDTLLERLGAGLDVIDRGNALSATIDWAISLLETNDRAGLVQATAFDGGFDLDAAEAVIDVGPGRVIDWLQEMVRRSLISVRRNARGSRYELYEAVKHRAAQLLDDDGRSAVHARFCAYFAHAAARWAEAAASRRRPWMHHERRNLRAAEARAVDPVLLAEIVLAGEVGRFGKAAFETDRARLELVVSGARKAGADALLARSLVEQGRFLRLRGYAKEATASLDEAVACAERSETNALIALTRVERGRLLVDLGEYERGAHELEAGLALSPSQPRLLGDAHMSLGIVAYYDDDFDAAERAFERARVHYERGEDRAGQASAVANKAAVARSRRHFERARRGFNSAASLHRLEGNLRGEAIALSNLGNVERCIGCYGDARAHLGEALRLLGMMDERRSQTLARCFLAFLELAEGDVDAAETAFERARVEGEDILSPRDFVLIVEGLVEVAEARGELERACDLRAEAERLRARRTVVHIAADGSWFRTSGGPSVCLARRRSARLVVAALVAQRERAPSSSLSREQMVQAGWPGERILEKAARQRLYVLINTLRRLGLDALETTDAGYRLDPEAAYEVR